MQLKAMACLYAETFMLAKNLCEMTTDAKAVSTCIIVSAVEKFLMVGFLGFFLCWWKPHCRYCIVYARGEILLFIQFILFAKVI